MDKALIEKIKKAKVPKNKKWLYNYTKWLLTKKDMSYHDLQARLNNCFYQSYGYFAGYYQNMTKEEKKEYNKIQVRRVSTSKAKLEKQRLLEKDMRTIYKLYKRGELSRKSINLIEKKIGGKRK